MTTARYEKLIKASRYHGDDNSCTAIALAVVADVSFGKAAAALARAGRKKGDGADFLTVAAAAKELGVVLGVEKGVTGKTMNSIVKTLDKGTFLCYTSGHVAAMVDGVVHDYTAGRRHRVLTVIQCGEQA